MCITQPVINQQRPTMPHVYTAALALNYADYSSETVQERLEALGSFDVAILKREGGFNKREV
jgi:hypothetical protein